MIMTMIHTYMLPFIAACYDDTSGRVLLHSSSVQGLLAKVIFIDLLNADINLNFAAAMYLIFFLFLGDLQKYLNVQAIGILGDVPDRMLALGRNTTKYFCNKSYVYKEGTESDEESDHELDSEERGEDSEQEEYDDAEGKQPRLPKPSSNSGITTSEDPARDSSIDKTIDSDGNYEVESENSGNGHYSQTEHDEPNRSFKPNHPRCRCIRVFQPVVRILSCF